MVLPPFNGVTILSIGTNYPHKNLIITTEVAKNLKRDYPDINFRFILTIDETEFPTLDSDIKDCFVSFCNNLFNL